MSFFVSEAMAEGAAGPAQVPFFANPLFMMVVMVVIFYFLLIRPQSKRNKEHRQLLDSLAKGDEVVLVGGMLGRITKVADDFVVIEVAPEIEIRFQRSAVTATLPKGTIKSI
jgi:preprotein translocase subunit YajC